MRSKLGAFAVAFAMLSAGCERVLKFDNASFDTLVDSTAKVFFNLKDKQQDLQLERAMEATYRATEATTGHVAQAGPYRKFMGCAVESRAESCKDARAYYDGTYTFKGGNPDYIAGEIAAMQAWVQVLDGKSAEELISESLKTK